MTDTSPPTPHPFKQFSLSPLDVADLHTEPIRPLDDCFVPGRLQESTVEVRFHSERQDTECQAWMRMLELVEEAAKDGREVLWPARELDPEDWLRIVELPPSIAKLKSVRALRLYGSHLVRIP